MDSYTPYYKVNISTHTLARRVTEVGWKKM